MLFISMEENNVVQLGKHKTCTHTALYFLLAFIYSVGKSKSAVCYVSTMLWEHHVGNSRGPNQVEQWSWFLIDVNGKVDRIW